MYGPMLRSLGLICLIAGIASGESETRYSQTYAIFIKGGPAGSEKVTEKVDAAGRLVSTSEHEIFVTDGLEMKRLAFETSMILSRRDYRPMRYSCTYTSGDTHDSYEIEAKEDGAITRTLMRAGRTSETTGVLEPDGVIIDFNVYHQYDYLIGHYDAKKKGRQTFHNFLPIIGNSVPIALTLLDASELGQGKVKIPVHNYRMEFVGIWTGTLSMDHEGRLVRLLVPSQDLEVIRKDLVPD